MSNYKIQKVDQLIVTGHCVNNITFPLCDRAPTVVEGIGVYVKNSKSGGAVGGKLINNYEFDVLVPNGKVWTSTSGAAWCIIVIDNKWSFTEKASNVMTCILKCGITDCLINEKCTFAKVRNSFIVVPKRLIDDLVIQDILE